MKTSPTPPIFETFPRSDAQKVLQRARRAADPDFYVQKATGRVLTKFLLIVGGLQVGGVFFWLILVFTGVVDATMNLDGFMVSQLVFFLLSIVIGLFVVVRHIRTLKEEAQALTPGLAHPLMEYIDPEADVDEPGDELPAKLTDHEEFEDIDNRLHIRWSARGTVDDDPYHMWEMGPPPSDDDDSGDRAEFFFCALRRTNRPEEMATALAQGEHTEAWSGDFSLRADEESVILLHRNSAPLLRTRDEVHDVTADELCAAADEIATTLRILSGRG